MIYNIEFENDNKEIAELIDDYAFFIYYYNNLCKEYKTILKPIREQWENDTLGMYKRLKYKSDIIMQMLNKIEFERFQNLFDKFCSNYNSDKYRIFEFIIWYGKSFTKNMCCHYFLEILKNKDCIIKKRNKNKKYIE